MKFRLVLVLFITGILLSCERGKEKLVIFHAGSLSVPMTQIKEAYLEENPDLVIKSEAAGSRTCARKISDLGRECDVFASADYSVIDELLIPEHASWNISFASNEMALAYGPHSLYSEAITGENWYAMLLKDEVNFGRSDPDSDPCGYRTVITLRLADRHYGVNQSKNLLEKDLEHIRPKETDLLGMLETGVLDYIFVYRSVAQQHGLQILELPPEINLGSPKLEAFYSTAGVEISGRTPGSVIVKRGEPMVYGLTIPENAANPGRAIDFVKFMLSAKGQAIMEKNGQASLVPSPSNSFDQIPGPLQEFARKPESR